MQKIAERREPFKVAFGPGRLEGTFDLTSVENADAMIQAINALKGLLPAKEPSRPVSPWNAVQSVPARQDGEEFAGMSDLECVEYALSVVLAKCRKRSPASIPPSGETVMAWFAAALNEARALRLDANPSGAPENDEAAN